jgi:hypothetical protein
MTDETVPQCQHWMLGNITVDEHGGLVLYERAILVTFATIEEYRAALRYLDPVFSNNSALEEHL